MVKVYFLLKRRADLTPEQFDRYWREQHAPLFCGMEIARRYVVRYEQNHAVPEDVGERLATPDVVRSPRQFAFVARDQRELRALASQLTRDDEPEPA